MKLARSTSDRSAAGLKLVDLQAATEGLTIQTYRTIGRPQYETTTT